eukprot:10839439-Lingulodinium_polyedra.AAC.1
MHHHHLQTHPALFSIHTTSTAICSHFGSIQPMAVGVEFDGQYIRLLSGMKGQALLHSGTGELIQLPGGGWQLDTSPTGWALLGRGNSHD